MEGSNYGENFRPVRARKKVRKIRRILCLKLGHVISPLQRIVDKSVKICFIKSGSLTLIFVTIIVRNLSIVLGIIVFLIDEFLLP